MTFSNLFLDSDILLDMLLNRSPFHTQMLLYEGKSRKLGLNTSTLIIANVNYVLSKSIGKISAKQEIKKLVKNLNVLAFESDSLDLALDSDHRDFEDSIQYFIAKKNNCDVIITRNIKDYQQQADIPVLTAEDFLRTIL